MEAEEGGEGDLQNHLQLVYDVNYVLSQRSVILLFYSLKKKTL